MNPTFTSPITSPNSLAPFLKTSSFNFCSFPQTQNHSHHHHRRRRWSFQAPFTIKASVPLKLPTTAGVNYTEQRQDKVLLSNVIKQISKPIAITVFWIVIGLCPTQGFLQNPAIAAPVISEIFKSKRSKSQQRESSWKDHEFSDYTRRLLETVSGLVRVIEEVRSDNGDLKNVEVALNDVKLKKKELQDEILTGLYAELRVLRGKKLELDRRSGEILDKVMKSKRERDRVVEKGGVKKAMDQAVAEFEEMLNNNDKEFMEISEESGEIEDQMSRKETMALSIGVRELCFIERESIALVENFIREMKRKDTKRYAFEV